MTVEDFKAKYNAVDNRTVAEKNRAGDIFLPNGELTPETKKDLNRWRRRTALEIEFLLEDAEQEQSTDSDTKGIIN